MEWFRQRGLVGVGLAQDVLDGLVDCVAEKIEVSLCTCGRAWAPQPERQKARLRTRVDGVGILVGDLDAELLLDGHDDLDGVEAVEAEVVGEVGGGLDLWAG